MVPVPGPESAREFMAVQCEEEGEILSREFYREKQQVKTEWTREEEPEIRTDFQIQFEAK